MRFLAPRGVPHPGPWTRCLGCDAPRREHLGEGNACPPSSHPLCPGADGLCLVLDPECPALAEVLDRDEGGEGGP